MESVTQIEILDEVVYFPLRADTLKKALIHLFFPPAMNK